MVAGVSKLARFPVELPKTPLPDNIKPKDVAVNFEDVLTRVHNPSSFTSDAIWRDTFAMTGTLRTFYSSEGITKAWDAASKLSTTVVEDSLVINHNLAMIMAAPNGGNWVEVSGSFRTKTANGLTGECSLMMAVVPEGSEWKIWTLRTILDDIEEFPSVNQYSLPVTNGNTDTRHVEKYFDAVVVGGGQCGLGAAGRLQALGIDYVLIDKYEQIGDSWKTRYDSVRLHTIREYSHLPFERTFPSDKYQEYLTKDELAEGFQAWAQKYGIDQHVWTRTVLLSGSWDGKQWSLKIRRNGQEMVLRTRFVVMASGAGGQIPRSHDLPGRETFRGTVLHSQQYKSSQAWTGKRGVVVGIANTAHDVADDMCEAGLLTTMIQRSQTYVMPDKYWQQVSQRTYNKDFPTDLADKLLSTGPTAVGRLIVVSTLHQMAASEPERFEALQKAGFSVEPKGDITFHLSDKPGGYYMDTGTSKKIADGRVSETPP